MNNQIIITILVIIFILVVINNNNLDNNLNNDNKGILEPIFLCSTEDCRSEQKLKLLKLKKNLKLIANDYYTNNDISDKNRRKFNIKLSDNKGSYVINQKQIYLMLWNSKLGKFFDDNTLLYVALHELSHVLCEDCKEDHGLEWRDLFSLLLNMAEDRKLYKHKDEHDYPSVLD